MQPSLQPVEPLDMRQFNPRAGYEQVAPLLGTFDSARRNQIFRNYVDHVDAESRGDYDALMATCSRRRQWYVNPFGSAAQNAAQPQSYAELEDHYRRLASPTPTSSTAARWTSSSSATTSCSSTA